MSLYTTAGRLDQSVSPAPSRQCRKSFRRIWGPKGGKGPGNHMKPMQDHLAMMMKETKSGGKGKPESQDSWNPGSTGKQGKGVGKSETRECYDCGSKGRLARNCPKPKGNKHRIQKRNTKTKLQIESSKTKHIKQSKNRTKSQQII